MVNPFEAVKEALQIKEVLTFYGVKLTHGNKTLCPLHNEKSPSFTVYPNHNSWHCFGCKVGGTVIDFVMAYHGLDALEAGKKLDADFNLGVFGCEPTLEELKKLSEKRKQTQVYKGLIDTFQAYMDKSFIILCDYFHLLTDWKEMYAPKTTEELDPVNLLFVEACHQLEYIEYLIDCLQYADYDEQIQFYQIYRKEMVEIATKVKHHRSRRKVDDSA